MGNQGNDGTSDSCRAPDPAPNRSDTMTSWYAICARATGAEVAIYDEIGAYGISAKGFLAELGALPEGVPIDLRLNSPGGSVFDAVAIHNALQRHEGTVTVWIDGIAASAASYVAMAGDEIVMPQNAFLMIHDPSGIVIGTGDDMRKTAAALDKIKTSLVQGYAAKSGRAGEEISALMAAETWFDANDAFDLGLADRVIEPVRVAARFDIARFRNAPPALLASAETGTEPASVPNDTEPGRQDDNLPAAEAGRDDLPAAENDAACDTGDDRQLVDAACNIEEGDIAEPDAEGSGGEAAHAGLPVSELPTAAELPAEPDPADAAAIRLAAIAHARAVVDLCALAGAPHMAGRFLEQGLSLDEVRFALLDEKTKAEPAIAAHHRQPGKNPAARPWGEILARTFKLERMNP